MNMLPLRAALAATLLATAIGASAKPLVVCTEASPEGFDPVLYTTAVTADAAAECRRRGLEFPAPTGPQSPVAQTIHGRFPVL